jgi:trehalose-6-phosphate synthase
MEVTREFARTIVQTISPVDWIWIHDFHLIMLPQVLRESGVRNRVGFFLHTPFPPADQLAKLYNAEQLLMSLKQADLCGFQTVADTVNFRDCLRAWKQTGGAMPRLGDFPVGIDNERYQMSIERPAVRERFERLEQRLTGRTVIFSMSRLDYTKGILEQLEAVESLLARWPEPTNLYYKLVVAPSREDLIEYHDLKEAIDLRVKQINERLGRPGWKPVDYSFRNHAFDEVTSWYRRADIMLVTPLIDGMNLIGKEYVAAHADGGVLILSKKAGAATQLGQALLVDPQDTRQVEAALEQALTMPEDQRRRRHAALRQVVAQQDATQWARDFIDALAS